MDLTKEGIEQWFDRTYPGCKILKLDMASSEQFNLEARCWHGNIAMDKFCKLFIDRFSAFTLTNWTVNSTFPKVQRMLYRKTYRCHLSVANKRRRDTSKRNKDCSASIALRFKKMTKNTCKKDKLLRDGLNAEIKISFQHSHSISTLESYSFLRCTQRTKERYLEFFNMGIPTIEAKIFNEIYVRLTYYDTKEREMHLANGMVNVSYRKILQLYYDWKKNKNFKFDSFSRLKQEKENFESLGFYLKIVETPKIVVVLTPLTKKVFKEYCEEIFIDSSGVTGKEIQYVTSVFVPSKVGALPIGYVIHDGHTEQEYEEGFKVLAAAISEFCGKPLRPKVVITNDGDQLEELGRIFPTCVVELCPFANLTKFWTFIWDANNSINEDDRKRLMTKYYEYLTSKSTVDCENLMSDIMSDPKFSENPSLVELLNQLWSPKINWCKIKTQTKTLYDNILTSTHMRVYKEVVVRKVQKFNVYVIVKLLTEVMEGMYKRYLIRFAQNDSAMCSLFGVFYDNPVSYNILPVGQNEYMIQSLTELDQVCTVYTDIIYCTCGHSTGGRNGAYCVHLCAVEIEFPFLTYPSIDENEKEFYNFPELKSEVVKAIDNFERIDDDISFEGKYKQDRSKVAQVATNIEIKQEPTPNTEMNSSIHINKVIDEMKQSDAEEDTISIMRNNEMNTRKRTRSNKEKSYKQKCLELTEEPFSPSKQIKLEQSPEELMNYSEDNERIDYSEHTEDIDDREQSEDEEVTKKSETISRKEARSKIKENVSDEDETFPLSKLKQESENSISDEDSEIIGKSWVVVYKRLTPKQKIFAKKAIDDILFEASLGTLDRNSVVINQSVHNFDVDPIDIKNDSSDEN